MPQIDRCAIMLLRKYVIYKNSKLITISPSRSLQEPNSLNTLATVLLRHACSRANCGTISRLANALCITVFLGSPAEIIAHAVQGCAANDTSVTVFLLHAFPPAAGSFLHPIRLLHSLSLPRALRYILLVYIFGVYSSLICP